MAMYGKRVFVVGASQGIGKATALEFAAQGAHVAVGSRTRDKLQAVVDAMPHGKGHVIVLDQTDLEQCKAAVGQAVEALGGLDVLVVVGGVGMEGKQDPFGTAALESLFRYHVTSPLALINEALPHLEKSKGVIVNVSSAAALMPFTETAAYCVAKAAQDMLTKCLALKLGPSGVRVVGVAPGAIATPTVEGVFFNFGLKALGKSAEEVTPEERDKAMALGRKTMGNFHAMMRVGEPEEVGKTIVFLSSPGAAFITGTVLPIDGGAHLTSWFSRPPSSTTAKEASSS